MTDKTNWAYTIDHNGFSFDCPQCDERIADAFSGAEKWGPCPACGAMLHITVGVHVGEYKRPAPTLDDVLSDNLWDSSDRIEIIMLVGGWEARWLRPYKAPVVAVGDTVDAAIRAVIAAAPKDRDA